MKHLTLSLLFMLSINSHFAQTRVVLIEQFTNSSCAPCGAISPSVYAFTNNTPGVAAIAYHTLFPYNNDSMYFENPMEATQRVNYYSVSGVPNSILDGNVYNGSSTAFVANVSNLVSNRLNVAPRYDISASNLTLSGNQLSGAFKFTSLSGANTSDNLVAHVVVIEKNVLKSAYTASPGANSETEYGYVMRKMIPGASGTSLVNTALNGSDNVPLNWTLANIKNKSELRVVAFVQNVTTKEVYQAQFFSISETPVGILERTVALDKIDIFPNPSTGEFSISFKSEQSITSISILNQTGAVLFRDETDVITQLITRKVDLAAGVYFVRIETQAGSTTKKLILTN